MPDGTAILGESLPLPTPSDIGLGARRRVDIEQLLAWAVRDQRETASGANIPSTLGYPKVSGCGRIGAYIDGGGAGPALGDPDAEVVVQAVARLPVKARRLVVFHAARADRPDWLPTTPRFAVRPVLDPGTDRPRIIGGRIRRAWCPIVIDDNRPALEAARASYTLWHTALMALQLTLSAPPTPLSRWWPTGPDAALAPWLGTTP